MLPAQPFNSDDIDDVAEFCSLDLGGGGGHGHGRGNGGRGRGKPGSDRRQAGKDMSNILRDCTFKPLK